MLGEYHDCEVRLTILCFYISRRSLRAIVAAKRSTDLVGQIGDTNAIDDGAGMLGQAQG